MTNNITKMQLKRISNVTDAMKKAETKFNVNGDFETLKQELDNVSDTIKREKKLLIQEMYAEYKRRKENGEI